MRLNKKREIKRRPRKGFGYDDFFFSGCKFDIIINGVIYPNEYFVQKPDHKVPEMWHTMYDVSWERLQDFIENVVWGYITKRIAIELNFDRDRAYLGFQVFDDSIREEKGLPPAVEAYTDSIVSLCYEVLHEEYPLCIDFESCGVFSEDEKHAKVVIKVVR